MTVRISKEQNEIHLSNARLRLTVDLVSLRMDLESTSGATRLRGFQPRVITERGALVATDPVLEGSGTLRTRSGVASRVHLESRLSAKLWLCADIDLAEDWPGISLKFTLANRGIDSVRVDALDALCWNAEEEASELRLTHPMGTQILEMGFHTDAPARWRRLGSSPWLQPFAKARPEHRGPFTPAPAWGLHVSDFVTSLRPPCESGGASTPEAEELTLGFISHDRFLSFVFARVNGARIQQLTASSFTEALMLPPRSRLASEKLWIGVSTPGEEGLVNWAAHTGREMQASVPGRRLAGCFSSQDAHDSSQFAESLDEAVRCRTSEETVFEVGGNYAPYLGDWLTPSAGFPQGPGALAQEIRRAGLTPRIWIAPFLVSENSRLAERHPEWLLRTTEGGPLRPPYPLPDVWGSVFVLDPSHPEVLDWLQKLGDTIRGLGFDQIALRYLDVGLLPGARKRPELGTAEAYRQALEALRGPVEPSGQTCLVGERAPIGPSAGLLDIVRCGPDWGPFWSPRLGARGVDSGGSAEVALRNLLVRAPLHQRLWVHEVGPLRLAEASNDLDPDERLSLAILAAATGSPVALADRPRDLDSTAIQLFRQLSPASGRPSASLDTRNDGLVTAFPDGSHLVFRMNFSRRSASLQIDLERLGITPPVFVWDILGQSFLNASNGVVELSDVPGHGCLWLRVTPVDERPRVVGSGIHLCAGALETSRLRILPSGAIAIRLQLPGNRHGEVWVSRDGQNAPLAACVAFEGNLEFALSEIIPEPEAEA